MSDSGRERRAEIDDRTVRALLLMNGGGAVSLLAFLGNVVTEPALSSLLIWVVSGLLCFHLGLFVAVVHNHLRRRCDLANERGDVAGAEGVCWWSWFFLYASMVLFFVGGAVVVAGSFKTFL